MLDWPNLFPGLKNYWFIWGGDGPAQFVFTWGTVGHWMRVEGETARYPQQGLLAWGHHPETGKRVIFNGTRRMEHPPSGDFNFAGEGEGYRLELGDTSLHLGGESAPRTRFPGRGPVMGHNEFRPFEGELFGYDVKGRALLQRYCVWSPFFSWDWFLFDTPQGDRGQFFRPLRVGTGFNWNGEQLPCRLRVGDGRLRLESDRLNLSTEPYARETVHMAGLGRFRYTEFLVGVSGTVDGKEVNGHGIVEEARGFII